MENDMKINIQDYGLGRKREETKNMNMLQSEVSILCDRAMWKISVWPHAGFATVFLY